MRSAFIFHGTGGSPEGNWFPWLKNKLEDKDVQVFIPQFPTPEGQSLASWLAILHQYDDYISEETIFVGHSLGGMFLLKVLEKLGHPVYGAFFVATPVGIKPIKFYDSDYAFTQFAFDWPRIVGKARHVAVWHSDNDPYISIGNGEELARQLHVKLNLIPNAGHLSAESGYTTLEPLFEEIEKIL